MDANESMGKRRGRYTVLLPKRQRGIHRFLALNLFIGTAIIPITFPIKALGHQPIASSSTSSCPQELEPLVEQMLKDLPAYINRENTRANNRKTYIMLASKADFNALPLFQPSVSARPSSTTDKPTQLFFTTLLRRYSQQSIVQQQEHHWLFLAKGNLGWQFVQLYSILDSYPSQKAPTPSRNSSSGSVAQAIKTWLKHCRFSQR